MNALATRAELTKLGALLGVEESDLAYLESLHLADLKLFRERVTDRLFEADRKRLEGIAAATKIVPTALSAKVAQKTFPAPLAARLAGLLDPGKAVDLAQRLPATYLADMVPHLDPRRLEAILPQLPVALIAEVGQLVAKRGQYVPLGRFVGYLGDDAIRRTVEGVSDEAMLRVGFVIEDTHKLPDLVRLLPEVRLRGVVRAAYEKHLWPEALNLLDFLDDATKGHIADVAAGEEEGVLDAMIGVAHDEALWDIALPVARAMSVPARERFASLPGFSDPDVIDGVVKAAVDQQLWDELWPLVPGLPTASQERIAETVRGLDAGLRARLADHARAIDAYDALGPVGAALEG